MCEVQILTCDSNSLLLTELKTLATNQLTANSNEFKEPYPWDYDFCKYNPHAIHFVAVYHSIICGWATISIHTYGTINTAELQAITTRQKKIDNLRIGLILHNSIVQFAQSHAVDILFLHAVSESVAKIYQKWGYKKVFDDDEIYSLNSEVRTHAALMMVYNISNLKNLTPQFKEMLIRDAEQIVETGSYGGDYRNIYKGGQRYRLRHRKTLHKKTPHKKRHSTQRTNKYHK